MEESKLYRLMRKVCSEKEIKSGKCQCQFEASLTQTNFIPSQSTSLTCSKRLV